MARHGLWVEFLDQVGQKQQPRGGPGREDAGAVEVAKDFQGLEVPDMGQIDGREGLQGGQLITTPQGRW